MQNDTNLHSINAIYRATEGEGIFVGRPQIFVRYQGCNVGCLNCDSKETWEFTAKNALTLDQVMAEILRENFNGKIKTVSITGGDPLHPTLVPSVLQLVKKLKELHYYINIEAAGTRVVDEIFSQVDFISFDLKTPSTAVITPLKLIEKMARDYGDKFQLKAVIADERDFCYAQKTYDDLIAANVPMSFTFVLTPCYNPHEPFPLERFKNILALNEAAGGIFRVIGQQHKWIFGPDKKNV